VIAVVHERRAMKVVRAAARNHVDRTNAGDAGRKVIVEGRNLEFLHRLLRKVLRRAARYAVIDRSSIHRNARLCLISARDGDAEEVVRAGAGR